MQLTPVQVRILGCLIEKERTTPDNYPLTMNGLLAACNQSTNRYPVVSFTQATVANALENLKGDGLLRFDYSRSKRSDKYRHVLGSVLDVDDAEISLLSVLMLRGPQTGAELRARTDRLHAFADQGEVDAVLNRMAARPEPLVVRLSPLPGQKEARWAHLLAGEVAPEDVAAASAASGASDAGRISRTERIEALEAAVAELTTEVNHLRTAHEALEARLNGLL
ncbi:MAG: YceH family protein [Actinobacteria bacterium]|nr:YceH family protein [Actinomycetota bacterium]